MTDPIVDAVCAKLQSRSAVGIKKYGTTLADNPATIKERLIHAQEEAMDLANYLEWLLQEKEMPTSMTIEMEADEKQAARDNFNYADANNLRMDDLGENTKKTIRAALQSPRDNPIEPISFVCWEENGVRLKTRHGEFIVTTPKQSPQAPTYAQRQEALGAFNHWLFTWQTDAVVNKHVKTIRAALQSPHVPVIEGLDEAINGFKQDIFASARFKTVMQAARAYAELQKGV